MGRSWERSEFRIFEGINIFSYCHNLPEGSLCMMRIFNVNNSFLLSVIESNFRKFILSHLIINPYFWQPESLEKYMNKGFAKNMPSLRGVHIKGSWVKLAGFPFQFQIPDKGKVQSIRLQTGLIAKNKSSQWTGYGLQWVRLGENKDMVCGIGVEPMGAQSAFILNFLRDRKKQEKLKKIKGEDPEPLPGLWYRTFRGLKKPIQAFGYCAPIEEDPRTTGEFFVDFKKAKPLKYNYKIGG